MSQSPPSVQAKTSANRVLRIGIVQAGRIIEEKVMRPAESVSIGTSTRNTFTILASSLPKGYTLFEPSANRTYLLFTDAIDGRISIGGRILTLAQAVKENIAQRRGVGWRLALGSETRGKLLIGDVTVLFQFVAPLPPQPRARLPRSIRGGFFTQVDWMLANCILVVLCLEVGFVATLRSVEWPSEFSIDRVPDRFARYIVLERPKPKPKEKDKDAAATSAEEAAPKAEAEKAEKRRDSTPKKPVDPEAAARAAAERRARLVEQVSRVGALKILGSKGGAGAVADLIRRGDPSADADRAFANVGGVGMATAGDASLQGKGASGGGTAVGIDGLRSVGGPGAVESGARSGEKAVKGVVRDEAPSVDGSIDPGTIAREIRRRMGAVRACYERELKRNPQLGGKIIVRFVIGSTGAVTEAEIESSTMADDAVGECIIANIKRFRFAPPEGGSVEVSYPFVFQPSS